MKPGKILIVEDEEDIRDSLQLALEWEGYEVLVASNGQEGLAALEYNQKLCVILLDLMMPVMDGVEFLKIHRNNTALSNIPIIVLSAVGDLEKKGVGASEFIKKPVDLDALFAVIKKYCPI